MMLKECTILVTCLMSLNCVAENGDSPVAFVGAAPFEDNGCDPETEVLNSIAELEVDRSAICFVLQNFAETTEFIDVQQRLFRVASVTVTLGDMPAFGVETSSVVFPDDSRSALIVPLPRGILGAGQIVSASFQAVGTMAGVAMSTEFLNIPVQAYDDPYFPGAP